MRSTFRFALLISVFAAACGGDSSGPSKAGPAASVTAANGGTQEGQAGQTLATPLTAKVVDAQGRAVVGAPVHFTIAAGGGSLSAPSDTTDGEGLASVIWTVGPQLGAGRAEARTAGVLVPAIFNANIKAGPAAAMLRSSTAPGASAAGFELADSVRIKITDSFGNAVSGASVTFAVTSGGGTVSPLTATTGPDGMARAQWVLGGGSGTQQLRAAAGGLQVDVDATATACTQSMIPVGGVVSVGPTDPKCVVLGGAAQRYYVTVVNTAANAGATGSFRMRGLGSGTSTTSTPASLASARTALPTLSAELRREMDDAHERIERHDALLRANERVLQQMIPQARRQSAALRMQSRAQPVDPPKVGDILNMRIPGNFANLCSLQGAHNVAARVVYVGAHGVMLEDTLAPLRGQLDNLYQQVGDEFDNRMWDILTTNFGNPLAMDATTDNNQRFYMLFSKVVNDMQGGTIAGFVSSSDFFSNTSCPSSNMAEVFYARVPTTEADDFSSGSAKDWYRRTRTVMIHEVKHIVSFAERIANPAYTPTSTFNAEDRWLEESSAMLAEELWARAVFGYHNKATVDYASSIYCEVRPSPSASWPQCQPARPLSMLDHFFLLYEYQSDVEARSPLGPISSSDFTFYGSGWSFLRWVVDTYGVSESAFLRAMVSDVTRPGVANLEARTGRTFGELISDWAVAVAVDDYPNFTPANPKHGMASWNTRDIFAGLNADFSSQNVFTDATPLKTRPLGFGKIGIDVTGVRGGTMAIFELSGTQNAQQMLEFRGPSGTSFPADMRVNIVRVE